MTARLDWQRDGLDWPNRAASQFITAAGLNWHVQVMGQGPVVLLVHGTGASTHSWRGLAPLISERTTVVAMDLPGHGFTQRPRCAEGLSLPGMAQALHGLLQTMDVTPTVVVGHSAGAAILARMCLDKRVAPLATVAVNGAMLRLRSVRGTLFSPLAKLIAPSSLVPRLFARRAANCAVVRRLLQATGSTIDAVGIHLYARLISCEAHVAAALAMMANWDLTQLERDLPKLTTPLTLVVGGNDRTISPEEQLRVCDLVGATRAVYLRGLGHLAHEERPAEVASIILGLIEPQTAFA